MVQAINRIHPQNTLVTHTDDCFYIYNDDLWTKASTNYYKYFDTDISGLNPNDFEINDYIITYKSISNYIKFSETFRAEDTKIDGISQWNTIGLTHFTKDENYKFPNTGKNSTKLQTNNDAINISVNNSVNNSASSESDDPMEHSISQKFYTNPNELYIASCLVKQVSSTTNNLSLQLFNDTYKVGISAKFDLNDVSGYDYNDYKEVTCSFIDSNFNIVPNTNPVLSHFSNVSAGIYKIYNNSEIYFRLVIKCSCDFDSCMKVKFLLLDSESNYVYTSKDGQAKYVIYVNAFQLEKYKDLTITAPSEYIITSDEISTLKIFDKLYRVYINPTTSNKEIVRTYNKVHYIYDIQERSELIPNVGIATYLESFKPTITSPLNWDIALVPSLISFSPKRNIKIYRTVKTYVDIIKSYEDNNNEKPKENQIVCVKNDETHGGKESLYQYRNTRWIYLLYDDCVIKLGNSYHVENPDNTINYDIINSQYIIKTNNSYKILGYQSDEKNKKSMVKAMTFNQGYFETWCKQDRGDSHKFGYNTGGGFNYHRIEKFFPKL